ncbi:MAG: FG-GAP repeat domain-containing protein [Planctomycetota bacterium]
MTKRSCRLRRGALLAVTVGTLWTAISSGAGFTETSTVRLQLSVSTPLKYSNTPLDPRINFAGFLSEAGIDGVLDPNSIEVRNRATGQVVLHALSNDFFYGDQGRIEFVAVDPSHTEFEIRFRAVKKRPPIMSRKSTPPIGVGDLLRYNSGRPGPVTLMQSMGLHDVTGDGRADLVGTWNYFRRPEAPTGGVVFYPAVKGSTPWAFGDLQRLRYATADGELRQFSHHYNSSAFADFNQDGRCDFVYTRSGSKTAEFYLATDKRDPGGATTFQQSGSVVVSGDNPCRAVDLNGDGVIDLVVNGEYIRNTGAGWPFEAAQPVTIDAGDGACYCDIDGDGRVDSVCLSAEEDTGPGSNKRVAWRRNTTGSDSPMFAAARSIGGVELENCTMVATSLVNERRLLLVQTDYQQIHIFERTSTKPVTFERRGRADSVSAVLSLSDQAWPCLCDWDADGDLDLLVGHGYGWPRILINEGTRTRPVFAEPKNILANGKPIRLLRNELLGPPDNWHNMGYSYPDFVDWDGDGLRDLLLPNETNRIYWYRNVGSKTEPRFGKRQQILCEGFRDSPEMRSRSQRRANDPKSNNGVYPREADRPFFWRTGAAFADFTGDGLTDLVTMDGVQRQATLFAQSRSEDKPNASASLRLKRVRTLKLADGRSIDDRIINRRSHWTESFRAIDWDTDGLTDLIYSVAGAHSGTKDGGSIYLLRNVGTKTDPVFAEPVTMRCFGEPIRITNHGPHPWPGDFDGDGKPDLIACVEWSVYPYYSHAALMMAERPEYTLKLQTE